MLPFVVLSLLSAPPRPVLIAEDGRPRAVIVLAAGAGAAEQTAAAELQAHLRASTGAAFRIVDERTAGGAEARIRLGQGAAVRRLLPGVDWKALGTDGIVLRSVGRDIVLSGGLPRGALYAAYEFLERVVGCRWWDSKAALIPKHARLSVQPLDFTYSPQIICREPHFYLPNHDGVWDARNRANGHFNTVPAAYGGNMRILGWCHTFYQLVPPAEHFAAHPEWFSLIDGQRRTDGAQLCLTNPEVRAELTRAALDWIRRDPSAGFISIAQNDCDGHCRCAACQAIEDEEGSPSGPLLRFVNAVAADIEKEFPEFHIETLAYQYTRKAPKVTRPRRNVTIRLCSIECDYGLPLTHPRNRAFLDDLKAWSAISPQLFIWTYIASFGDYYYPNPTLPVYGPNIRAFAQNHAVGVFMQGDSYNAAACFVRLRAWVVARLLWNPALDEGKLVEEFLKGYYGPAAPALGAYLRLIDAAYARRTASEWMTPGDVLAGYRLFAEAERAAAGQAEIIARVQRERLPLDYIWMTRHKRMVRAAREAGGPLPAPETLAGAVKLFRAWAIGSQSMFRSEGQESSGWLDATLAAARMAPAAPPAELGALEAGSWVDLQEPDYRLFGMGDWVTIAPDAAASNGQAARLATHHTQWAVQTPLDGLDPGRYRVYLSVRADAADTTAAAATFGIYDGQSSAGLLSRVIPAADIAGPKYRLLDMGVHELSPGMYAWFSPAGNSAQVSAVWIDRVFLIRQ